MLDFVRRRNWYYLLSLLVLLPGIISLHRPARAEAGHRVHQRQHVRSQLPEHRPETDMRAEMTAARPSRGEGAATGVNRYLVRTSELAGSADAGARRRAAADRRAAIDNAGALQQVRADAQGRRQPGDRRLQGNPIPWTVQSSAVSGTVSREIGRNAAIAVVAASIAILLYISWAFRSIPNPFRCGIAATIATGHDVVLVMGAYSIFGKVFNMEVNTMFITGLLTVIGFSVHDTIVVLDRIRENRQRYPDLPLHESSTTASFRRWDAPSTRPSPSSWRSWRCCSSAASPSGPSSSSCSSGR